MGSIKWFLGATAKFVITLAHADIVQYVQYVQYVLLTLLILFILFQVEQLFGDRKKLILPIVFDIANLVRTAASSTQNTFNGNYQEHETIPEAQYLRRSFSESLSDMLDKYEAVNTTEVEVPASHLKDDRLQIEESDSSTKPIKPQDTDNTSETQSKSGSRSFHERKLNMTNFEGSTDQDAMESSVRLQVTLPRSFSSMPNISLEQYENLALSDLNDTLAENQVLKTNSTEGLPTPEMLISRYRVKNPYRKNTLVHPPTGIDLRTCERFGTLCLHVEDYPM